MSRHANENISVAAYVTPFALYVVPTMFELSSFLGLEYEVVCTLKGVLAAGALLAFRKHYPVFSTVGFRLGIVTGTIGFVCWVALERLQAVLPGMHQVTRLLQLGNRAGFDPFSNGGPSATTNLFVFVRLIELTIIVPLVEELFWRGFLSRYLIAEDFESVEHGTFTAISFFVVTIAFTSVHPEILAAIVWGVMINLIYRKTANLWACVAMHAVTNGILGGYILATGSWYLW